MTSYASPYGQSLGQQGGYQGPMPQNGGFGFGGNTQQGGYPMQQAGFGGYPQFGGQMYGGIGGLGFNPMMGPGFGQPMGGFGGYGGYGGGYGQPMGGFGGFGQPMGGFGGYGGGFGGGYGGGFGGYGGGFGQPMGGYGGGPMFGGIGGLGYNPMMGPQFGQPMGQFGYGRQQPQIDAGYGDGRPYPQQRGNMPNVFIPQGGGMGGGETPDDFIPRGPRQASIDIGSALRGLAGNTSMGGGYGGPIDEGTGGGYPNQGPLSKLQQLMNPPVGKQITSLVPEEGMPQYGRDINHSTAQQNLMQLMQQMRGSPIQAAPEPSFIY